MIEEIYIGNTQISIAEDFVESSSQSVAEILDRIKRIAFRYIEECSSEHFYFTHESPQKGHSERKETA